MSQTAQNSLSAPAFFALIAERVEPHSGKILHRRSNPPTSMHYIPRNKTYNPQKIPKNAGVLSEIL